MARIIGNIPDPNEHHRLIEAAAQRFLETSGMAERDRRIEEAARVLRDHLADRAAAARAEAARLERREQARTALAVVGIVVAFAMFTIAIINLATLG